MTSHNEQAPDFARRHPNLALARLGCEVVAASDDFFADKARLIGAAAPVFIPNKYDDNGKWMDGWETRRRRGGGNDWCALKLGRAAHVVGVDLDTTHFTGNYPHAAALEGGGFDSGDDGAAAGGVDDVRDWAPLLPQTPLRGDSHHWLKTAATEKALRWLRLSIFPDGGIARLRVYGRISPPPAAPGELRDLAALLNGGRVVAVSDSHFGAPENMLSPGRGENMGDGWETRRRREPGADWAVIALGGAGKIRRVEVDTAHFKGNYPAAFSLNGARAPDLNDAAAVASSMFWPRLMGETPLTADAEHVFSDGIAADEAVTHVRLNIYPDGGVSRLRLFAD